MERSSGPSLPPTAAKVLRRRPVVCFVVMASAFSWLVSLLYVLATWGILKGDYSFAFVLKPFVGPALAAIILTSVTGRWPDRGGA